MPWFNKVSTNPLLLLLPQELGVLVLEYVGQVLAHSAHVVVDVLLGDRKAPRDGDGRWRRGIRMGAFHLGTHLPQPREALPDTHPLHTHTGYRTLLYRRQLENTSRMSAANSSAVPYRLRLSLSCTVPRSMGCFTIKK